MVVIGKAAFTRMLNCWTAVCGVGVAESVTVTLKVEVPDAVGMPLIAPVVAFNVRPAGKLPVVTLHL